MSNAVAATPVDEYVASLDGRVDYERADGALGRFAVDGEPPEIAVFPIDEESLGLAIAEAHAGGLACIVIGGGTHLGAGNTPRAYDVAVVLERMNAIVAYEPDDMTVTVEPGMRLTALQGQLAAHGQMLPIDPPADERATVGGMLAANAFGPMRHAYGTARDWLIGLRVVQADGVATKAGGRVVKNVTGYDMPKLHVGALGTLGIISEATFKLLPLPAAEATVVVRSGSAQAACAFVQQAHDLGLALAAAEVLSPPASNAVLGVSQWTVACRLAGVPAAVNRSLRECRALCDSRGDGLTVREAADVWPAWRAAFTPRVMSLRTSVLPSQVAETLELLDRRLIGAAAMLSATVSAGVVRAQLEPGRIRAVTLLEHAREAAERRGGWVNIDAAPAALKRQTDIFGALRPDIAIMRRLKEEFDPQGTLSPGRFAGRL